MQIQIDHSKSIIQLVSAHFALCIAVCIYCFLTY